MKTYLRSWDGDRYEIWWQRRVDENLAYRQARWEARKAVLRARAKPGMTLVEIGSHIHRSGARVRQICLDATRHSMRIAPVEQYFNQTIITDIDPKERKQTAERLLTTLQALMKG